MATKPNVLFIFTDQQNATMLGCTGNAYLRTPAMDSLAERGTRFERAYCTNPVCLPSRFSLMTGRMPSEIGVRLNSVKHLDAVPEHIVESGLGHVLKRAGYDVGYGGKIHLPRMHPTDLGFDYITDDERDGLAQACADYVKRDRTRPFFLVASFINPHDICYMAIRRFAETEHSKRLVSRASGSAELAALDEALERPPGLTDAEFFRDLCPPLPPNFEPQEDEPDAVNELLDQRPFKRKARENWTTEDWRLHRWAYCRLTERVDRQIQTVLDALEESGKAEDTLVVFTSDHGDHDSSHRMEHKTALYEEACRIPLIIADPHTSTAGAVDRTHLVSNGLDLLPTLCDYAGADVPPNLLGQSLRPIVEGPPPADWRQALPVESEIGGAIITERYKYVLYDEGKSREQLYDLQIDPHETRNFADDTTHADALARGRTLFSQGALRQAPTPTSPAGPQGAHGEQPSPL